VVWKAAQYGRPTFAPEDQARVRGPNQPSVKCAQRLRLCEGTGLKPLIVRDREMGVRGKRAGQSTSRRRERGPRRNPRPEARREGEA